MRQAEPPKTKKPPAPPKPKPKAEESDVEATPRNPAVWNSDPALAARLAEF